MLQILLSLTTFFNFDRDKQHHYLSSGKKQPIKPRSVVLGNLFQVTLLEHRARQRDLKGPLPTSTTLG